MRVITGLAVAFVGCSCSIVRDPVAQAAGESRQTVGPHRVAAHFGTRAFQDSAYDEVESQRTLGLSYAFERTGDYAGFEAALFVSRDEDERAGLSVEGRSSELAVGARKSFHFGSITPYVGAGLAVVRTDLEVAGSTDENGGSLAAYAHTGIELGLTEHAFIGLDGRVLFGSDIQFRAFDTDGDYGQLTLQFGVRF